MTDLHQSRNWSFSLRKSINYFGHLSTLKNIKFSLDWIDWFLFSFASFISLYQFIFHNKKNVTKVENAQLILRMLHFFILILRTLKRLPWKDFIDGDVSIILRMYLEVTNIFANYPLKWQKLNPVLMVFKFWRNAFIR